MRLTRINTLIAGLTLALAGCGAVSVEMTSTPDRVNFGDPVTFDIKLTNRSQCPVGPPQVQLTAFIPVENFEFEILGDMPSDPPEELLELVDLIEAFFDELCAGGLPTEPDMALSPASCARDAGDILCTITGPAPGQQEPTGSMTFATLGNRLRCEVNNGTLNCQLRLPLPPAGAAGEARGSAGLVVNQTLDCVPGGDQAFCAVGDIDNPLGLLGGQMAIGQVVLPASGSGPLRNLVFVLQEDESEIGVCKGGTDVGQACSQDSMLDCPGSSCGEGICLNGTNAGGGCDEATAMVDCPGGTCELCSELSGFGLPIDCTETYVAPQRAPAASPWGLVALAAVLCAAGMWLLRRRLRGHQA